MSDDGNPQRVELELPEDEFGVHVPLLRGLRCLDKVLTLAVDHQARLLGPASLLDPWRGMHLDRSEVQRLLQATPRDAHFTGTESNVAELLCAGLQESPRGQLLADKLRLEAVDLAIVLIALAPDIDVRYERIYGYLQDNLIRKRPTVDFIANLLGRNPAERLFICSRFHASMPLRRFTLLVDEKVAGQSALATAWRVDDMWQSWLLGNDDEGVSRSGCALAYTAPLPLDELPLDPVAEGLLHRAIHSAAAEANPLRLLLQGPHGAGKLTLARCIVRDLGQRLLVLDVRNLSDAQELRERLERAQRAAILFNSALFIHGIGQLEQHDLQAYRALMDTLAGSSCNYILSAAEPISSALSMPLPLVRIELALPAARARFVLWTQALAKHELESDPNSLERIASRFSLSAPQIEQAAAEAHVAALLLRRRTVDYGAMAGIVRRQCGTELARLAQRITARADFSSIVVSTEVKMQLEEICARVATRDRVGGDWANGSVHARAAGVTALFVGPSGTGKTLSAEAVAQKLDVDLFRIDLAGIVSKYIGETEKNLDRVFLAAENANAVLLFDEADALFGKRSEVKDARDRYANIEVAYLLQKMERFNGLAILATNLKQNLDDSFARRITFTVNFAFPEEAERQRLWESLWPPHAPRARDVDLAWFAREYRLSGGNIRNTMMAAAYLAADDGEVINRKHLLHATRREFQKMGKTIARPNPSNGAAA